MARLITHCVPGVISLLNVILSEAKNLFCATEILRSHKTLPQNDSIIKEALFDLR